jgi:decaprenylphospho-beta-D-ribofuranose 2-oxidase
VHGKNQHTDGSIAAWLDSVELMDGTGTLRTLTPDGEPQAFRATVGGMGLTGVLLAATLRLLPLRSALLHVTSRRVPDLDSLLAALSDATARSRYAVAWIDGTAGGRALGRGIVEAADQLPSPHPRREREGLHYEPGRVLHAPALPINPVGPFAARAFNDLWYWKTPRRSEGLLTEAAFFHRLDAVAGWNRVFGPKGIWQYQLAVPDASVGVLARALEGLRRHRAAPFLGTLKRFGPGDGHPLSFPMAGWSLAVDMPAARPHTAELLDALDRQVAAAGGRIYLAKDARMDRGCFRDMYGPLDDWHAARAELDPHGVFRSDLGRRLGLCG